MIEGTTNGNVNRQDTLLTRAQLALELRCRCEWWI